MMGDEVASPLYQCEMGEIAVVETEHVMHKECIA